MSTMHELEKEIRQEIRDEAAELLVDQYPEDRIMEMVDSSVPVYTSDLMAIAAADVFLATAEPEVGPAFDGSPTPANIVAANVYDRLNAIANEEWEKVKDEAEECVNCGNLLVEDDIIMVNVEAPDFSMDNPYPGSGGDVACEGCATEVAI